MRKNKFNFFSRRFCLGCVQRCARNKTAKINKEFCLLLGRLFSIGWKKACCECLFFWKILLHILATQVQTVLRRKKASISIQNGCARFRWCWNVSLSCPLLCNGFLKGDGDAWIHRFHRWKPYKRADRRYLWKVLTRNFIHFSMHIQRSLNEK